MADQYVVVELRVDASNAQAGAAQYSDALDKAQAAADALTGSATKAQAAITNQSNAMVQAKAANDNIAAAYRVANDNLQNFGKSLADRAIDFLNNVNHLKLMALAAYAVSPAFRSFANAELSAALRLVGANITIVESALSGISKVAAPALSFFSRIAIPIGIAVAAWQGFNYVLNQGADLLTKYGNANRQADIADDLTKLTKFQSDTVTPQQAQYATQLASEMADAKKSISDFFAVQIDVTDSALRLQAIWVGILQTIAGALNALGGFTDKLSSIASSFGNLPIWNFLNFGWKLPGMPTAIGPNAPTSNTNALALARQHLGTALGLANFDDNGKPVGMSFDARFSGAIHALANTDNKDTKDKSNAYQRQLQSVKDQIDLLNLEAQGAGKTSQAYQELKVAHDLNIAAMKSGIKPTDDMRAEWKTLADQIAAATVALNQNKVLMDETFKGATMFMSPSQAASANAAHQIDPNNWMAHLDDAGPKLAAFNSELGQMRDTSVSFADNFTQGLAQGKTALQSLQGALQNLESQLIQMINKQLINQLFGAAGGANGLFSFLFSTGTSAASGGAGVRAGANLVSSAFGNVFLNGRLQRFAYGGIVSSPTLFPMANGAGLMGEAGPEAVMPLSRGSNGRLGVSMSGAGIQNNIQVINSGTGATAEVQSSQRNSTGGVDLVVAVKKIVNDHAANGGLDPVMKGRYGTQLRAKSR